MWAALWLLCLTDHLGHKMALLMWPAGGELPVNLQSRFHVKMYPYSSKSYDNCIYMKKKMMRQHSVGFLMFSRSPEHL